MISALKCMAFENSMVSLFEQMMCIFLKIQGVFQLSALLTICKDTIILPLQ